MPNPNESFKNASMEVLAREMSNAYPWYPLRPIDRQPGLFEAHPRLLGASEIDDVINSIVSKDLRNGVFANDLRERNQSMIDASGGNISIVLDGRSGSIYEGSAPTEGYLGDVVEGASVISALSDLGANVTVFTPHIGTITSDESRGIHVEGLPIDMPHQPHYPWTTQTLKFIHDTNPDSAIFFPLNAALPNLISTNDRGEILNIRDLQEIRLAIFGKTGVFDADQERLRTIIKESVWSKRGLHQLQALQVSLHLLGFDLDAHVQTLPESYLRPSPQAQQHARALSQELFRDRTSSEDGVPLFVHIGVATGSHKVDSKYYPMKHWKEVMGQLSTEGLPISGTIFFIPSDKKQAQDTMEIAQIAQANGQRVAYMPEQALASRYGWSLGTFISFLQQLSAHEGVVLGCDSMPVHAAAATGNRTVVIGNRAFNPAFYAPRAATMVLPSESLFTSSIEPSQVVRAVAHSVYNKK